MGNAGDLKAQKAQEKDKVRLGNTMTARIEPLKWEDMLRLAKTMRRMDRLEAECAKPDASLEEILALSKRTSIRARAAFWNNTLVACWGIVPLDREHTDGVPWLLTTDAIEQRDVKRAFFRYGKRELDALTKGFRRLSNLVHRDNNKAQKWLRIMGFKFNDPRRYTLAGEPFVKFEWESA